MYGCVPYDYGGDVVTVDDGHDETVVTATGHAIESEREFSSVSEGSNLLGGNLKSEYVTRADETSEGASGEKSGSDEVSYSVSISCQLLLSYNSFVFSMPLLFFKIIYLIHSTTKSRDVG